MRRHDAGQFRIATQGHIRSHGWQDLQAHGQGWKPGPTGCILAHMADSEKEPVMLPFQDKVGTGWHVVIRYHAGHERRIDGFATEREALDWIIANAKEVDK
jgi:hypothetical protein